VVPSPGSSGPTQPRLQLRELCGLGSQGDARHRAALADAFVDTAINSRNSRLFAHWEHNQRNERQKMTKAELTAARKELGMNKAEMAKRLRTPYGTYNKWELGTRRVPGVCETALELLLKIDRLQMQAIKELCARTK
jgi:DNA-binding transcriptional regulator YiaG